jgi:cytochrome c553
VFTYQEGLAIYVSGPSSVGWWGMFITMMGDIAAFVSRFSGIMSGIATTLSDETMRTVATYYEGLPPREAERSGDRAALDRGAAIAMRGVPAQEIPPCAECHGPTELPRNPAYPRLATQHARYLVSQLELLKQRRRGGSPNVALMQVFVDRLRSEQIRDIALHFAPLDSQPAANRTFVINLTDSPLTPRLHSGRCRECQTTCTGPDGAMLRAPHTRPTLSRSAGTRNDGARFLTT